MKKLTEKERKARNEYSRKWKAAHAAKVKKWNKAWLADQKKPKAKAKKARKVRQMPKAKKAAALDVLNRAARAEGVA